MPKVKQVVIAGVDTHKDTHVAAVIDEKGRLLGTASFATTDKGLGELSDWMASFGEILKVGVEGTCAYGAGLSPPPSR
ncbi:MAG: transposase [Actinomycetota bacterium]|nr:transposase [Actinomycetota bacterium]